MIPMTMIAILAIIFGAMLGLALTVFWIWMLVHAITNKGLSDIEKLIWVVVVLFLHALGALLYFIIAKPKGTAAVA